MAPDYYELLRVPRDADADSIKRAFRTLAREIHPDVSGDPDAEQRFREISEAYAVLSEEESRRLYDRLGWRGRGNGFAPRREAARVYASNPRAFLQDLESVLASAVGRRPDREPTRVIGELAVDPYEAHVGATRSVEVVEPQPCPACNASGRRRVVEHRESGRFVSLQPCSECGGTGELDAERPVEVTVPPRVRDLDRVPVGPDEVAIVRIVPPRDRLGVRLAAAAALLAAVAFLLFLLSL